MDDTLSIQIWLNERAHKGELFRDLKGSLPSSHESEEHVFTGGILFWVLKIQENFKVSLDDGGHLNLYLSMLPPKTVQIDKKNKWNHH